MQSPLLLAFLLATQSPSPAPTPSATALLEMGSYLQRRASGVSLADRASVAALDASVAEGGSPLVAARARFEQMRSVAKAGGLNYARRDAAALGLMPSGWMIGPFPHTGAARIEAATPPEAQGLEEGWAAGEVDGRPWQEVHADPRQAVLDVGAHLASTREVRVLLVGVAVADVATPAALRVSSSAQVVAILNGRTLLTRDVHRPLGWDQDSVGVQLAAGPNLVVLRLGNLKGPLTARVRLTAPDGSPLRGVEWSNDLELRKESLRTAPPAAAAPEVVSIERALEALVADPPLHRPVAKDGSDRLTAAIRVEEERRAYDQRTSPSAHELWRLALLLRLRTTPASKARDRELAETLVAVADALVDDDPTLARERYDAARELDPTFAPAVLGLARLRAAQDNDAETVRLLREALKLAPNDDVANVEAWDGLRVRGWRTLEIDRTVLQRAETSSSAELVQLGADIAEGRGDLATAWRLGERLVAWDEADPVGHRLVLSKLLAPLSEADPDPKLLDRAIDRLELILLHRPHAHRVARKLALMMSAAGQQLRVDQLLAQRRERYAALPAPWALTAEVATWRADRKAARAALREALARSPQDRDLRTMLRTLEPEGDDLARRYGLKAEDYLQAPLPAEAEETGAHVAHRQVAVRFFENGLGTVVEDRLIQIHDKNKASGFAEIAFPYAEGREVIEVLRALRLRPDGTRIAAADVVDRGPQGKVDGVYTDERAAVVDFGQLESGDLLWVRTRKDLVGRENLFGAFFGVIEPMQWAVPTSHFTLIIEAPASRPLAFGGRGAPQPTVSEDGERRVYRFEQDDIPRIPLERNMPPFLEVADYVSVSSVARWEELGDWYKDLVGGALKTDRELAQVAREATRGATTTEEKVRRLYEHVVTHTRYVGIELGIHGWKPYPVTEVWRRRYGDCKDKASLLVALLHEVGVDARLVLVRTADLGTLEPSPPSMWIFNHAIAYVPALDLYLDGTSEFGGYRELPAFDQGAMVLLISPYTDDPARLARIPLDPASSNVNEATYALTLRPDGRLDIKGTERFSGVPAAEQRAELADQAGRKTALERSLAHGLPGVKVLGLEATGLKLGDPQSGYDFRASLPGRGRRLPSGQVQLPISLYPQELTSGWAQQSERTWGVWLSAPWRTRNVMRYRLPPGWSVERLPTGGVVDSTHLRFEQTVSPTPDGFVVEEETILKSRHIPAAAYPGFRQATTRADELMRAAALLNPKSPDA